MEIVTDSFSVDPFAGPCWLEIVRRQYYEESGAGRYSCPMFPRTDKHTAARAPLRAQSCSIGAARE